MMKPELFPLHARIHESVCVCVCVNAALFTAGGSPIKGDAFARCARKLTHK